MSKIFKRISFVICLLILIFGVYVFIDTPFGAIDNLSDTLNATYSQIEEINKNHTFGRFVMAHYKKNLPVSSGNDEKLKVSLKLFNLFELKSFDINSDDIDVYVGGNVIGFTLSGDGVMILGKSPVLTENGEFDTTKYSDIKNGDIIKNLNNEEVKSIADIYRITNDNQNKNKDLSIKLSRNGDMIDTTISNRFDKNSGICKIGLWVKDDVSGIGTLTYVRKDNNRFGSLGHSICDNDTKTIYDISNGEAYNCTIIGINKGYKGKAGEMKGLFVQGKSNKIGKIDKNCEYGVFGKMEKFSKDQKTLKAGGRLSAKQGKAYIHCSLDGKNFDDYEIEIVKTNYQSKSSEKSMVIKVVDKNLIEKTGGIVQGMSGSPIIQDDKVIGAVTHVFINDPTKGFGIYLDWMINN